jgi:hypothetical protein
MGTCDFISEKIGPKVFRQTCRYCGRVVKVPTENYTSNENCKSPDAPDRKTVIMRFNNGPGTKLIEVTHELGFKAEKGCGCNSLAARMNRWGVEGCRGEHREQIIRHLRKRAAEAGWLDYGRAAVHAVMHATWYDPRDPAPGMLEEACRRSEAALAELARSPQRAEE